MCFLLQMCTARHAQVQRQHDNTDQRSDTYTQVIYILYIFILNLHDANQMYLYL